MIILHKMIVTTLIKVSLVKNQSVSSISKWPSGPVYSYQWKPKLDSVQLFITYCYINDSENGSH